MPKVTNLKKYKDYYQEKSLVYMRKRALNKKNSNKENYFYNNEENNNIEEKVLSLKKDLETIKVEYAWLESENMKNSKVLTDYNDKLLKLKRVQLELIEIINQQAEEIRSLKGYKKQHTNNNEKKKLINIPIIMLLPIAGMFLTGIMEYMRLYDPNLISNVINFCLKII